MHILLFAYCAEWKRPLTIRKGFSLSPAGSCCQLVRISVVSVRRAIVRRASRRPVHLFTARESSPIFIFISELRLLFILRKNVYYIYNSSVSLISIFRLVSFFFLHRFKPLTRHPGRPPGFLLIYRHCSYRTNLLNRRITMVGACTEGSRFIISFNNE